MAAIRGGPLGSHYWLCGGARRGGGFLCMETGHDSFGRGTRGFHGRGTERDAEQTKEGWDKDTCGPRCLAWGLVAQDFGQRADEI